MYAELLLRRENGHLCHVDEAIVDLLGWTAEEVMARSIQQLVTKDSYHKVKRIYLSGPPNTYGSCRLVLNAYHKDGHILKVHLFMFCRYNADGALEEAWGCVRRYSELDELEAWWTEVATREAQNAVMQLAQAYAAA